MSTATASGVDQFRRRISGNGQDEQASGSATPISEGASTPGSESGPETIATSTVTTEFRKSGEHDGESGTVTKGQTTTVTHVGAKNLEHRVDEDGELHLKPKLSSSAKRKGKKIRAVVSFKPRQSRFDRFNQDAAKDPFRGFYSLFWIGMAILMLNTFYSSFLSTGKIISLTFANLFSKDAGVLALSDGVLVGSLFFGVPFAKGLKRGWFKYWPTGAIIQHTWQGAMLGCVVKWARYREWPWVQSGFFVLHTLSMMMKIHSYLAVNGAMSQSHQKMLRVEKQLDERLLEIGGAVASTSNPSSAHESKQQAREEYNRKLNEIWVQAVKDSRSHSTSDAEVKFLGGRESQDIPEWTHLSTQRNHSARHELFAGTITRQRPNTSEKHSGEVGDEEISRDPHPLVSHPDRVVSLFAHEIEALREELLSVAPAKPDDVPESETESAGGKSSRVCWPDNITYANFWDYLLVPTLVYELEYPRTKSVRPLYVLEKTLATFGTFFVIYVITEHFIIPHSPHPDTPLIQTFLRLALPMMINYLLIFYIMFECVCNGFAELTRFADREFYQDWWNATSMDVFSRKWNKPVHSFLLKHVYASSISSFGFSKTSAMLATFLLSSFLHELVMAIVSGKIRGYLFAAQMAQLPLILVSKIPFIKNNETLGNLIFWIGLMCGFPLLNIGYLVY
ncbi:unnamed protein product [Sympodiomycopsis kandeliae]